jgi:molybdenum cofactor cytidylyltransferase
MADVMPPRAFAIIPAAGASRRMETAKLLLPWNGRTVIEQMLAAWQASRVDRVVITVAASDAELAAICDRAGAEVARLDVRPADMTASLQCGLQRLAEVAAPGDRDAVLFCPADVPWMRAATIDALIVAFAARPSRVVVPTHAGRRGHPVLMDYACAREVAALRPGESLRTVVDKRAARGELREIAADASIHGDLDTPEDYRAALARRAAGNPPT